MELLNQVVERWNSLKYKLKQTIDPIVNRASKSVRTLLDKVVGKERIDWFFAKSRELREDANEKFESKFDTEGRYFPLIKGIYKNTFRFTVGILLYYFLLKTDFLWLTGGMPSIEQLQDPKVSQASDIISADGLKIGKFFAENRVPVDSNQISPWVYKALVATEDIRFFKHSGIDLRSWVGVAVGILSGGDRGGGSTISQQLAKNLYNTRKSEMRGILYYIPLVRTIVFKTKEWITAVELEKRFTKGEIATMYLNTVDYGSNAYGIKTASRTYFNKEPIDLQPEEAAVLVGLQKATTYYNPIRNPKNSTKRRNVVLQLMAKNGSLSNQQAEKLIAKPMQLNINIESQTDAQGNYYKVAIAKMIEEWAKKNDKDIDVYRDGLKIYTTIDSRMQDYAEEAVRKQMRVLQKEFDAQWRGNNPWVYSTGEEIPGFIDTVAKRTTYYKQLAVKYNNQPDSINKYMNKPMKMRVFSYEGTKEVMMSHIDSLNYYKRFLQTGMMAMDPYTGFIKAWVGGINYEHFKYDHVKQGRRQPGSTFKPILYTAAIDGPKNMTPCDKIRDEPIKAEWVENGEKKIWEPKNATGAFTYANLTLRSALARSVNSVAAKLTLDIVGPARVVEYGKKLGITSPLQAVGSIGLGTSDVSLYEMIAAYGVFVNEGNYTKPLLVYKIEDKNGKVIAEFQPETRQAISQESAFLMQFMLRGNIEEAGGTGRRMFNYPFVFKNNGQMGGKTGTTSNNSDAWYIGFTKDIVCGSWVGGDDRSIHFRSSMGEGSKSALPIVGLFLDKVYSDKSLNYTAGPFPKPSVKITKDYQGCFSVGNPVDSTRVATDSLVQVMLKDSLAQMKKQAFDSIKIAPLQNKLRKKVNADSLGDLRRIRGNK